MAGWHFDSRLARHVLFFGLPLVLGLAAHALFNLVDTFLVGQLGELEGARAISVTGLADPISTFQVILFNGPIAGAGVILARAIGERDEEQIRKVARQAAGFVVLLSLAMAVPGVIWAEEIASAMGARSGWQLDQTREYLRIMLGGGITAGMFLYLTTVERSLGRTNVFLLFFVISNILNAVFGVFLIYGSGPYPSFFPPFVGAIGDALNLPRMGVIGSAWSTIAARGVAGGMILGYGLWRGHLRGRWRWLWPHGRSVLELMRIGMWNNGQIAARGIAGGVLIRSMQEAGRGDPSVLGGVFVGIKIELMLILISFGWGAAAQTLVAQSLGAQKPDRARQEERMAILFALVTGIGLTLPLFVFSKQIAAAFNPEPELIAWAETYIKLMAIAFVFTPVNVVISQAMIARNSLRTPVLTDSLILLGFLAPTLIIATLAGAAVQTLILINAGAVIVLTGSYLLLWRHALKRR